MIPTPSSFDLREKTIIVRVDLNTHVDKGKVQDNEKIRAAARSLRELHYYQNESKFILLAHQGRRGEKDFISLRQHAKILSRHMRRKISFVNDVAGPRAESAIKKMKPGDILLLDNVRFLKDETHTNAEKGICKINRFLSPLADIFINDAFSVSHRAQTSVVGFKMQSCFGWTMIDELGSLERALDPRGINVYMLGGAKSEDCIAIMEHILAANPKEMEYALLSGITANIFLKARGLRIGKKSEDIIKKRGLWTQIPKARRLLKKYPRRIILPVDVAIEEKGKRKEVDVKSVPKNASILDIGEKTIEIYKKILRKARTDLIKGPCGLYEDPRFRKGTKELFHFITHSRSYSVAGGGDTNQALDTLGLRKGFSHISLGGGALITYLSGKRMPGIDSIMRKGITDIKLKIVKNSANKPSFHVTLKTKDSEYSASIPKGTSRGKHECHDIEHEKAKKLLPGIKKGLQGMQSIMDVDRKIKQIDRTTNYSHVGGNLSLGVSMATARLQTNNDLWELNGRKNTFPYPMVNVIGGGRHGGNTDFQEFLIIPEAKTFPQAYLAAKKMHLRIGRELKRRGLLIGKNLENAWIAKLDEVETLSLLKSLKLNARLGLDVAASEFWNGKKYVYKEGSLSTQGHFHFLRTLVNEFDIYYVEDPFHEDDFSSFARLNHSVDSLVVGDDLTTTNHVRFREAIEKKSVSGIIIKPNQIGSLQITQNVVEMAKKHKITFVPSHRSSETMDNWMGDLCVAWGAPLFKSGIAGYDKPKLDRLNDLWNIIPKAKMAGI